MSGDIFVPAGLDREALEHFRCRIEDLQNRLCDEAESWAAAGTRKPGQLPILPKPRQPFVPAKR